MTELLDAIKSTESPYRPGGAHSFFADVYAAKLGSLEARGRLDLHRKDMHTRAAGTMATGTGVTPPDYMAEAFAPYSHGSRPCSDQCRSIEITDANPKVIGVQTGALTVDVTPENTVPPDGSMTVTALTVQPQALAGKLDASRQLVEGANPQLDQLVYTDGLSALNARTEQLLFTALAAQTGTAGQVALPTGGNTVLDSLIEAGRLVHVARKAAATHAFLSPDDYAHVAGLKSTTGQFLEMFGMGAPSGVAGFAAGLALVPSWAVPAGTIWVVRASDILILESAPVGFSFEEPLGPETVRLAVWAYAAAVTARYPLGIASALTGVS
jgi:hypothetical protein